VGVFADAPPGAIAGCARDLGLAAVQLHGDEDAAYCARLRTMLPAGCELWKAVQVQDRVPSPAELGADRVLLDAPHPTRRGGTGRRFDWGLLAELRDRSRYIVAGGLDAANAAKASALDAHALDVNSGVETAPGAKDPALLAAFFEALRTAPGSRRREDT
jgi:indole-3-glycerol phosphate synthase/phosphoribosylanthranilate isomerase